MTSAPVTRSPALLPDAPALGISARRAHVGTPRLRLMGEFRLEQHETPVALPHSTERLLAILAVKGHAISRALLAGMLWPEVTQERAAGNLRSSLWRLRRAGADVVQSSASTVALDAAVRVDLHEIIRDARACLDEQEVVDLDERLSGDLLPDWYDDWLVVERERLRQLRVQALEALCRRFLEAGFPGRAIDIGLTAVSVEPLRESAHRALISAHLAEGNVSEALRQFETFRGLVRDELGIEPSAAMLALVHPLRTRSTGDGAPHIRGTPRAHARRTHGGSVWRSSFVRSVMM